MSEYGGSETEGSPEQFNVLEVIRRLKEAGIDVEYDDDIGTDENDLLGNLVTLAYENGLGPEELFRLAGVPVDKFSQGE